MSDLIPRTELDDELDKLDRYAQQMDAIIRIPGTPFAFGLDALLGLVPVIGDTLALAPSLYILSKANRLGASPHAQGRMLFNIGIDYLIGLIPLVGDLFDFGWQANIRNTRILREEMGAPKEKGRPA